MWSGRCTPRNKTALSKLRIPSNVIITDPFSYFEMMIVLDGSKKVATDSGGLQKEAYWAKKPCVTIRTETEWVETLHNDWNILTERRRDKIYNALKKEINHDSWCQLYGDGTASQKIANHIAGTL